MSKHLVDEGEIRFDQVDHEVKQHEGIEILDANLVRRLKGLARDGKAE